MRVEALDLLRLIAVLGVIAFHYGFRGPTANGVSLVALPELSGLARYGFLGVPIFFVISGFVIAYSAEGRTATGFAIARFARIYPCFLFCMTLTFVSVLLFGAPQFSTGLRPWAANLFIAAPLLGQPYMDSAYWSLVIEAIFYFWVAVLIATGLFQRHRDIIVVAWLSLSLLNELTIDSPLLDKLLLADDSGFFATGILIYEFHKGRRDAVLYSLLAASITTAIYQATHNLEWLRWHSGDEFDDWVAAGICFGSIVAIIGATRIRHLPLPSAAVIGIGGMTYPLYLLHQQLGYVAFVRAGTIADPVIVAGVILTAIALLSWATWRHIERPAQRWTKQWLTGIALRCGLAAKPGVAAVTGPR